MSEKSVDVTSQHEEQSTLATANVPEMQNNEASTSTEHEAQRHSKRIANQKAKQNLLDSIKIQCDVNTLLLVEIKNQNPDLKRLQTIKTDLETSNKIIHALYNQFRKTLDEPDKVINQAIGKLTHDIQLLMEMVIQKMDSMTTKQKKAKSMLSDKTKVSSVATSVRSSTSSKLRYMQTQAAAAAAEIEAKLKASKVHVQEEIEAQLAKLNSAKKSAELQGQLHAETRKAAVYAQAIAEEEQNNSGLLMSSGLNDNAKAFPNTQNSNSLNSPPKDQTKCTTTTQDQNNTQPTSNINNQNSTQT
ncbi:uncharacterized protein [Watersipora subatra]|uniref:uncharacterized protein n=1 Tax=Watersipora subatra TaxID=2589382 RepID=UPI00355BAF25